MSKRKIIEIDVELCTGCGECVPSCAEGALAIVDGKARIVRDLYCDGLGACLGHCPTGALTIIEREAPEFDEAAAMEHVRRTRGETESHGHGHHGGHHGHHGHPHHPKHAQPLDAPRGCPGQAMRRFEAAPQGETGPAGPSQLTHWPIKLKLVPPTAPFLRGADLLIAADCVPGAMPGFHGELLRGKVMVMACPKFGEIDEIYAKLKDIFAHSGIRSVTVADMEVPCCSALPAMARQAMKEADSDIPYEEVVIGLRGQRLKGRPS